MILFDYLYMSRMKKISVFSVLNIFIYRFIKRISKSFSHIELNNKERALISFDRKSKCCRGQITMATMFETDCDPQINKHFKGHKNGITGISFRPDNKQLISSSSDKTVIVWNVESTDRACRFYGHKDSVLDVNFAPSGELFATASKDRTVRLWVPLVKGESLDFKAHMGAVRSVQFSPNGLNLITASDDKNVKLWMVARRRFLMSFIGHTNWVSCARFSPDGKLLVSCSDDRTIKLWDIDSGHCVKTFNELKGSPVDVEFHPSGAAIGTANMQGCVKIYDLRTASLRQHYNLHADVVNKAKFHPNGNFMLTASKDTTMKILDLLEGRPIYTLKGHTNSITAIAFSEQGDYFASGSEDRQLLLWKSNFDMDDKIRKIPRRLMSPTGKLKLDEPKDLERGERIEEAETEIRDSEQACNEMGNEEYCASPSESVERLNLESVNNNPSYRLSQNEPLQTEVTNLRNNSRSPQRYMAYNFVSRNPKRGRLQPSNPPTRIIEILSDKIDSLHDILIILEKRLTIMEDKFIK